MFGHLGLMSLSPMGIQFPPCLEQELFQAKTLSFSDGSFVLSFKLERGEYQFRCVSPSLQPFGIPFRVAACFKAFCREAQPAGDRDCLASTSLLVARYQRCLWAWLQFCLLTFTFAVTLLSNVSRFHWTKWNSKAAPQWCWLLFCSTSVTYLVMLVPVLFQTFVNKIILPFPSHLSHPKEV